MIEYWTLVSPVIIPFSVVVRFLYPVFGVWFGTLFSYALAVPLAILSYYLAQRE